MGKLYDRAEIYDLIESEDRYKVFKTHWEHILSGRDLRSLLDVSIGSGSATLPLAELGVRLSGSDLSENMLANCRKKAEARGFDIELKCCDFRNVADNFDGIFDCVASTGNSLPYVNNEDLLGTLEQMDSLVKPGGYLYFEIRNWDKILTDRKRFFPYAPFFDGDTRINLTQIWDYNSDGTITFNIMYLFEKDQRYVQMEVFEEHYFPIKRDLFLGKLKAMGYSDIQLLPYPSHVDTKGTPVEDLPWYCVVAQKP